MIDLPIDEMTASALAVAKLPPKTPSARAAAPLCVLHLVSSLQVGGAEKLLISLLQNARQDPSVRYVVIVMNDKVDPALRQAIQAIGCPVHFLDRPEGKLRPRYIRRLVSLIRREKVDIVHAHNPGSIVWAGLCKIILPRLRVVYTVHDPRTVHQFGRFVKPFLRWIVDENIAISRAVAAECARAGITRVILIYNGIDLAAFARRGAAAPIGEPLRIVNVARLTLATKGQDILLRAMALCIARGFSVSCRLVGPVPDEDPQSIVTLRQLAQDLGIADRVEFVIGRTQVAGLLHDADIFVLPSRYEGLGLAVLEAMAADLPVIVSNVDGPAELVRDGENGLVFVTEQPESLADRIVDLARDPMLAARLRRSAGAFIRDFDISRMRESYHARYHGLRRRPGVESAALPVAGSAES